MMKEGTGDRAQGTGERDRERRLDQEDWRDERIECVSL